MISLKPSRYYWQTSYLVAEVSYSMGREKLPKKIIKGVLKTCLMVKLGKFFQES